MADEKDFVLDFQHSTFEEEFEADLQIIYSRFCQPFDGAEEILLSEYSDKDDRSLEKLLDTVEVEDCESESDADSEASGPSRRANTSQDCFSDYEDNSTNLNEDFPLPLAESTRSDLTGEVVNATPNVCKSGQEQKLRSQRRILNQEEKKLSFLGSVEATESATCVSDLEGDSECAYSINPTLPKKSYMTEKRANKKNPSKGTCLEEQDSFSTHNENNLAAFALQARNRIAKCLAEALETQQLSSRQRPNKFNKRSKKKSPSLKWTPSSSATKNSIKLLSKNNANFPNENLTFPVNPKIPSSYLKERIIFNSKVCVTAESRLLTVKCQPTELPTHKAVESAKQSCGTQILPVSNSIPQNQSRTNMSSKRGKPPRPSNLVSFDTTVSQKSGESKISPFGIVTDFISTSKYLKQERNMTVTRNETISFTLTSTNSSSRAYRRSFGNGDTLNSERAQEVNKISLVMGAASSDIEAEKAVSSVKLPKTNDLSSPSLGIFSPKVRLRTDNKRSQVNSQFSAVKTDNDKIKSLIQRQVFAHPKTESSMTACEVLPTYRRKRTVDHDVSESGDGIPKKICRSEDKFLSATNHITNDVTRKSACHEPGKCLKPFCFHCAHL